MPNGYWLWMYWMRTWTVSMLRMSLHHTFPNNAWPMLINDRIIVKQIKKVLNSTNCMLDI
jgi:hypothetical protein